MTSIAHYKDEAVEILDRWTSGGQEFATVRAINGSPFVGGDKWPIRTPFANVKVEELEADPQADTEQRPNLLTMALRYQDRRQWYSGEAIHLMTDKQGRPLAWLKNLDGEVWLQVKTCRKSCLVYFLDPEDGWQVNPYLTMDYKSWAAAATQAGR